MRLFLSVGILFLLISAAFSQGHTSIKSKPWQEGFDPVQQKITAEAHNQGLEGALRFLSIYRISFYVDKSVMQRWSGTKFVFHFTDRPMWQIMEFVAADVSGYWQVENGICVLRANPMQYEIASTEVPVSSDTIIVQPASAIQEIRPAPAPYQMSERSAGPNSVDQRAANFLRMNLTNVQRKIMRSRGYLKNTELSRYQQTILSAWLRKIEPGKMKAVQSRGVYSQIKRVN